MHVAFASVSCFYVLINKKFGKSVKSIIFFFLFLLSLFLVLYINTRVAVVCAIFGYFFVFLFITFKNYSSSVLIKKGALVFLIFFLGMGAFVKIFPYTIKKFTSRSFANMEMVGRLDEFENPEVEVFSSLVTRVSIWKSALELSKSNLLFGYGAVDAKEKLFEYYKETNQKFLYKYKFPVHNQFIDYLIKYGILGPIALLVFFSFLCYLGFINKNSLMFFFVILFFLSNLTDDFFILYSGISFSAYWASIFGNYSNELDK
nr:O-antigen ligase family protein [Algibacter amylolyticus]